MLLVEHLGILFSLVFSCSPAPTCLQGNGFASLASIVMGLANIVVIAVVLMTMILMVVTLVVAVIVMAMVAMVMIIIMMELVGAVDDGNIDVIR